MKYQVTIEIDAHDIEKPKYSWDLVTLFYPNYTTSDDILENDALEQIWNEEEQPDSYAEEILKKRYGGDRKKVHNDLIESNSNVYWTTLSAIATSIIEIKPIIDGAEDSRPNMG